MKFSAAAMISLPLLLMNASSVSATQFLTSVDPGTGATIIAVARGSGAGSNAGTFTDAPSSGAGYANIVGQLSQSTKDRELLEKLLKSMSQDRLLMDAVARAIMGGELVADAIMRISLENGLAGAEDAGRARQEEAQRQLEARRDVMEALRRQQQEQAERARQEQDRIAAAAAERQQEVLRLIAQQKQEAAWRRALDDARNVSEYYPDYRGWPDDVPDGGASYEGNAYAYPSGGEPVGGKLYLDVDFGSRNILGRMEFGTTKLGMVGSASVGSGQSAMSGTLHVDSAPDGVFGGTAISRGDWEGAFEDSAAGSLSGIWRAMVMDGPNAGAVFGGFDGRREFDPD